MHAARLLLFLPPCLFIGSCQSPQPSVPLGQRPAAASQPLQRLAGTWVSWPIEQTGGCFLVRLTADSTGTFVMYGDRGPAHVRQYGGPRYYLSEGPVVVRYYPQLAGTVRYVPNLEVQLFMRDARFDYELRGDTLLEYDKEGYQGKLVRLHPTQ